ncbi:NUDIX hydrolase [Falsibacillus albus]|uniref:NUDIX domain-containing protein n=1 Tax=Falsibacillus albus TaxID=2478915 RepID=A0A3L7K2Z9_9BACI|nr:NUDIX hydrolase [Falsibacillus albus]RLQ97456.1 NUDIX domain-containing protein [Falsibacillus albus]
MSYKWLEWAKRIQSLSQAGLAFSKNVYDIERYQELRDISAEIIEQYTELDMGKIKELFHNEDGYQTPKVDVRGVVFRDQKILMVKEKLDECWSLPGGFCDIDLSPAENIIKEIKEEAGYDVKAVKLLAVLDKNKHPHPPEPYHYYKLFIQCEVIGGKAEAGLETNEVHFFDEDHLPELSLNRNTDSQIKLLFEFLRSPEKETVYD